MMTSFQDTLVRKKSLFLKSLIPSIWISFLHVFFFFKTANPLSFFFLLTIVLLWKTYQHPLKKKQKKNTNNNNNDVASEQNLQWSVYSSSKILCKRK